ncbi:MAG: hypothetical protein OEY49_05065 [Candidatus Heimdallarchaeota archaeon]|nr:hypothetical protein [Candidatus Heimdallarchaeota archaeon]
MVKFRGLFLIIPSLFAIVFEIYFLIYTKISSPSVTLTEGQYWGLAIPTLGVVLIIGLSGFWIGYTMMVTPDPIRFTYEEAYQNAEDELNKE